jgi:hypothetical protein
MPTDSVFCALKIQLILSLWLIAIKSEKLFN